MKNVVVTPEGFQKAVMQALAEYGDELYDTSKACAKSAGRKTVSELKSTSPVKTGRYARGWSHREKKEGLAWYTDAVYNRTDYQLVHLLEKPHATGGGGHYPSPGGKNHTGMVARVEQEQTQAFMEEVLSKI